MERGSDFGDSVPDWIPDSLLAEFQHRAAREVRRSRRSSPRAGAPVPFRSADVARRIGKVRQRPIDHHHLSPGIHRRG